MGVDMADTAGVPAEGEKKSYRLGGVHTLFEVATVHTGPANTVASGRMSNIRSISMKPTVTTVAPGNGFSAPLRAVAGG
jgi:hypothetical protein